MLECGSYRVRREAAERAERAELHRLAQILEQLKFFVAAAPGLAGIVHLGEHFHAIGTEKKVLHPLVQRLL